MRIIAMLKFIEIYSLINVEIPQHNFTGDNYSLKRQELVIMYLFLLQNFFLWGIELFFEKLFA
jgi:hypothetical protein